MQTNEEQKLESTFVFGADFQSFLCVFTIKLIKLHATNGTEFFFFSRKHLFPPPVSLTSKSRYVRFGIKNPTPFGTHFKRYSSG